MKKILIFIVLLIVSLVSAQTSSKESLRLFYGGEGNPSCFSDPDISISADSASNINNEEYECYVNSLKDQRTYSNAADIYLDYDSSDILSPKETRIKALDEAGYSHISLWFKNELWEISEENRAKVYTKLKEVSGFDKINEIVIVDEPYFNKWSFEKLKIAINEAKQNFPNKKLRINFAAKVTLPGYKIPEEIDTVSFDYYPWFLNSDAACKDETAWKQIIQDLTGKIKAKTDKPITYIAQGFTGREGKRYCPLTKDNVRWSYEVADANKLEGLSYWFPRGTKEYGQVVFTGYREPENEEAEQEIIRIGKDIVFKKQPVCGNGICEEGETQENCPKDCKESTEKITIHASDVTQQKSLQGFLLGWALDRDDPPNEKTIELIAQLKPKYWRMHDTSMYNFVKENFNPKITFDSYHYYWIWQGLEGPHLAKPWEDWAAYENQIRKIITSSKENNRPVDYWNPWAEPDTYHGWGGTCKQMLEMLERTYKVIRETDPDAKIVAPDLTAFAGPWTGGPCNPKGHEGGEHVLEKFLRFSAEKNLKWDAISWHELDSVPEDIPAHVNAAQKAIYDLSLGNPEIHINEFSGHIDHLIPGWTVGWLYYLEKAGVDWASKACWCAKIPFDCPAGPEWDCWHGLDGLFYDSMHPQPLYWVHWAYAKMTDQRLKSESTRAQTVAIASREDSKKQLNILVGRYGEKSYSWPPKGITPEDVELTIKDFPYALDKVEVEILRIPNENIDQPLDEPILISKKLYEVIDKTITISKKSFQDGDAFYITIKPISEPTCGDGVCDKTEDAKTCPQDCKECIPEWECKLEPATCPLVGIQNKICKDVRCGTGEERVEAIKCEPGSCAGCLTNGICYPVMSRMSRDGIASYCDVTKTIKEQKELDNACQNNYECKSNECSDGECISIKKEIEETQSLLKKILEWIKSIFE